MTFSTIVISVIENSFSYGPNLKIEIGGTVSILKMADVGFL